MAGAGARPSGREVGLDESPVIPVTYCRDTLVTPPPTPPPPQMCVFGLRQEAGA